MSFRSLTRCGSNFRTRHNSAVNFLREETTCRVFAVSSVISNRLHSHFSARHTHSRPFRIEGIQGPIPSPLSVKENKKLLDCAAKQANASFSQQGIQGCQLHTDHTHHNSVSPRPHSNDWELEDSACPQGVQGIADLKGGCGYFQAWLDNCRRYGLDNCDQQLQGIQSGRLTLAQVLADQEALIADIAEGYRKRTLDLPNVEDESIQGAQGNLHLPDINAPCPQGVQGDDCVRFKLWLENCHRFGIHECTQQLQGFQNGRLTLGQLFAQQDSIIRQVVQQYQQRRNYSSQPRGDGTESTSTTQVGDAAGDQLSQRARLKRAIKEYGSTVIVFHVAISLASLGGFYLAVSSGIDVVSILRSMNVGEAILQSKLATGTGTFVVAYAVHKVFAPVRIGITLTCTPFIVRYLRSKGVLKPPKKVS